MTLESSGASSLKQFLEPVLPKDQKFQLLQLQSFPRKAPNIIVDDKSSGKSNLTIKTQHFIALAKDDIILLGLEVFVYVIVNAANEFKNPDPITKLIYISKVDSTGLGEKNVKLTLVVQRVLAYLLSVKVDHYINVYLDPSLPSNTKTNFSSLPTKRLLRRLIDDVDKKITKIEIPASDISFSSLAKNKNLIGKPVISEISLFTRSESQYLFPLSHKNKDKHVLSDRKLLSWWLYLLNNLLIDCSVVKKNIHNTLAIPGEDRLSTKRFLAGLKKLESSSADGSKNNEEVWNLGGLFDTEGPDQGERAIYHIPLFPDDPKGRFLEHLVVENRASKLTLKQFWDELAIRQEFRLASVVGLINIKAVSAVNEAYHSATANSGLQDLKLANNSNRYFKNGVEIVDLKVHELKDNNIIVNNFADDLIVVTNKRLKQLKKYIIGEEYDSIHGAKEAYKNITFIISTECNHRYKKSKLFSSSEGSESESAPDKGFKTVVGQLDYAAYEARKQHAEGHKRAASCSNAVQMLSVKKLKKRKVNVSSENNDK